MHWGTLGILIVVTFTPTGTHLSLALVWMFAKKSHSFSEIHPQRCKALSVVLEDLFILNSCFV